MKNDRQLLAMMAAQILSGMLSDWTTLSNAAYKTNNNVWDHAAQSSMEMAKQLLAKLPREVTGREGEE